MKFRIDLKILFFLALFYLTRQLKIYLIVMLFAFLHEISHLIIGLILGFRPQAFEMMPFGFSMNLLPKQKHELEINFPQGDANNQLKINFPQKNEFTTNISYKIAKNKKNTLNENFIELKYIFVALAGPIFNLIIAGVLYKFDFGLENELRNLIFYSNILLCIFNLVPLYPLDGGRVARGILNIFLGEKKSREFMRLISNITIFIITFIGSVAILYLKNIAVLIILIYLWIMYLKEKD